MATAAPAKPLTKVGKNSPYEDGVQNNWADAAEYAAEDAPESENSNLIPKKSWSDKWKESTNWEKAGMIKHEVQSAQMASMIVAPIVSSAITANCQTNNLKEQAFLAKQRAKQLQAKWSSIQGDEEAFSSDVQNDTSAALKLISTTQTNMAIQRAIFLRNYKNTQKIGMFLITLVFFALLIKWVFFGKNVDPFIPGLVGKKGKKRSTSRRKSKKKWWKF